MIKLGKVYKNKMIDVSVSNKKLLDRAARILMELLDLNLEDSLNLLELSKGSAKKAILMKLANLSFIEADNILNNDKLNLLLYQISSYKVNLHNIHRITPLITIYRVFLSKLNNADMHGAQLNDALAYATDFEGADLRDVDFTGALLMESTFTNALIDGADFTDAVISRIQQKELCSMASGTNSKTEEDTSYSLGC